MRSICAAALALAAGILLAFADEKSPSDAKTSRVEQLKKIVTHYDKDLADLKKRYANTSDQAEQRGIMEEVRELAILSARDAVKLAEEDPTDAVALDAAVFVAQKTAPRGSTKELDALTAIVVAHHLGNPKVKDFIPAFASAGPAGQKFLVTVSEKATDKSVKGLAYFHLGMALAKQLQQEEDGKKIDELMARATDYFQKAAKEAPDAVVGVTTVGKAAADELAALKSAKFVAIGKSAPDVEGTDLSGKKVKLSSYKGKVVMLDIWATWCGPCRAMIPHEREMVAKLKGKPFVLLSVSCDDELEKLTAFLEKEKMPWDHWFDGAGGAVAEAFHIQAFPSIFLINHAGVIRNKFIGNPGNETLEKAVESLVEEAVKAKG